MAVQAAFDTNYSYAAPTYAAPISAGVPVQAGAQLDTQTLLLIAGAALVVFLMFKRKS